MTDWRLEHGASLDALRRKSAAGDAEALATLLSEPEVDGLAAEGLAILDFLGADRDELPYPLGMGGGLLVPAKLTRADIRQEASCRGHVGIDLADLVEIVKALDIHLVMTTRKKLIEAAADAVKAAAKRR